MKNDYLKYIGSLLLFGSNGIMAAGVDLPSAEIVLLRASLGAALLMSLLVVLRGKPALLQSPRNLAYVLGSGVAMGVCWAFVYMAYREVGVGITSLLYSLGPVIVMMASPLLFKERLSALVCACFAVVVLGAVMTNGPVASDGMGVIGIAHGLAAAVAYAVMIVLCKKVQDADGLECSAFQLVAASVTALAAVGVQGVELAPIPVEGIAPMLMLGLLNTGVGCYLYFSSIGNLSVQTVAICDYIEPLSAVLLSAAVLGETMVAAQWVGAALVIVGAISCELVRRKVAVPTPVGDFSA